MIIGPAAKGTWTAGAECAVGSVAGIIVGFNSGWWLPGGAVEIALWVVLSFLILAMLNVKSGTWFFCIFVLLAYAWGRMGYETGNPIANERIIAEFIGVALAGAAVTILAGWGRLQHLIFNRTTDYCACRRHR